MQVNHRRERTTLRRDKLLSRLLQITRGCAAFGRDYPETILQKERRIPAPE